VEAGTLAALLEASAAINSSLSLEETLRTIAESAAKVLRAEASSVMLLERARGRLVFAAAVGEVGRDLIGEAFPIEGSIAGRVATAGLPVLVREARDEPDFNRRFDRQSRFVTRGMAAAPLRFREETLGVVEVLNRRGGGQFEPADLRVLQVFANLAAIAAFHAQRHESVVREVAGLRAGSAAADDMVGTSTALEDVRRLCGRVAASNATVLLLGETGTGKELAARYIHRQSTRRDGPFIAVNCAALPATLLESELFGHEAGAFTGASSAKPGRFELAEGGTLFLDEIGDMSADMQMRLLRVLQEREYMRVGGTRARSCDVRVIAATHHDLKEALRGGTFREDLYYRLNVFPVVVPPLRERREDVPALAAHFVEKTARELGRKVPLVVSEALARLCAYEWPGNIRELRNVLERAVLLCEGGEIDVADLPLETAGPPAGAAAGSGRSRLAESERGLIVAALEAHGWHQTAAAAALGITRDNLRYRMRKYRIRRPGK